MDCNDFLKIISEFEKSELSGELREEAIKHTDGCPNCKNELRKFKKIMSLTKDSMDAKLSLSATLKMSSSISKLIDEGKEPVFGPILNINDLSNYLRVREDIIETYLNEIPCFELGGQILFRKEKVDEWVGKREQKFAFELLGSEIERDFREDVFEEIETYAQTSARKKGGRIWQL